MRGRAGGLAIVVGLTVGIVPIATASAEVPAALEVGDEQPRGTYVWVPPTDLAADTDPVTDGSPHVLYLNRCTGGETITGGWPDDNTVNRSGILGGTVTFPEFPFGDAAWNEVVEHSRQIFSPFNILVTDEDPSPMPHDEAIVCGSGSLAGFSGAGGVAPFSCGVIDKPITFTFPESLGNSPRAIAEVIAQEAAHAWGLEHEYKCEDPMSYLYGCGDKTFQDGDYPCGEYSARACECGGNVQNSHQTILDLFGPAVADLENPTATITYPHDGETFSVGDDFDLTVDVSDDTGIERVALYLDGQVSTEDMAEPYGPWPVIDAPEGTYEFWIEAVDTVGKSTMSNTVRVHVTADGAPPPGGSGGEDTGDGGGPGTGGDDGVGDGTSGGSGQDDAGALPPGFGLDDAEAAGCACAARPTRVPPGWLAMGCALVALARRRLTAARRSRP